MQRKSIEHIIYTNNGVNSLEIGYECKEKVSNTLSTRIIDCGSKIIHICRIFIGSLLLNLKSQNKKKKRNIVTQKNICSSIKKKLTVAIGINLKRIMDLYLQKLSYSVTYRGSFKRNNLKMQ
ncbi:hypothetical protein QE152_g37629 [Popillia japonica]|uniref:Uncharacterized protein n=1 Tax=Popillia japonica TaxID=7064 RepID=A0AAW1I9Z2_POPJA